MMLCVSCIAQAPDFYKYLAFSTETFGISCPPSLFLTIFLYFGEKIPFRNELSQPLEFFIV